MSRFTLDQLSGFVAVAEELHFGRAAVRLSMTQPALSRQVQRLERAIGVTLFHRQDRTVSLTRAGSVFLVEARRLLALTESAPDLARRVAAGSQGAVRIGFAGAAAYGVLGRLLDTISTALPEIDLDVNERLSTQEHTEALLAGEIDIGLARPPFVSDHFGATLLHSEPMVVAVPAGHRLAAAGAPVSVDQLADEPLIMYSPTGVEYFHDLVLRVLPFARETATLTVSRILTMVWLVSAGRGVALVPASSMSLGIADVTYLQLADSDDGLVELYLLWWKESQNPALWRVLEVLHADLPRSMP